MPKINGSDDTYIVDCNALVVISQTTNNSLRSQAIDLLESGQMKVPTAVMGELKDAFEDEFNDLNPHISIKIRNKPAHTQKVGTLASRKGSSFRLEPYGQSDYTAAAVAECEGCKLVTTKSCKSFYSDIVDSDILTLEDIF